MTAKLLKIAAAALVAAALVSGTGSAVAKPLRINVTADPGMMDPVTYSELIAGDILKNIYEGFTDTDKDGKIVNVLATGWTADADNLGFRFSLRPGVRNPLRAQREPSISAGFARERSVMFRLCAARNVT